MKVEVGRREGGNKRQCIAMAFNDCYLLDLREIFYDEFAYEKVSWDLTP